MKNVEASQVPAPRLYYLDWLRALAVLLLIPFHTARVFDIWDPCYLLHQSVILVFAYVVVRWQAGVPVKYGVIAVTSLAATLLVYDLLVKRIGILRFLFGMKPHDASHRPGRQQTDQPAPAETAAGLLESRVD